MRGKAMTMSKTQIERMMDANQDAKVMRQHDEIVRLRAANALLTAEIDELRKELRYAREEISDLEWEARGSEA